MPAKSVTVKFQHTKATKNTEVYAETGDVIQVGSLYLQKATFAELGNPAELTVTIAAS